MVHALGTTRWKRDYHPSLEVRSIKVAIEEARVLISAALPTQNGQRFPLRPRCSAGWCRTVGQSLNSAHRRQSSPSFITWTY